MVGRIDLLLVVAASHQGPDFVVAHVGDHLQRARVAAKEVLAHIGTIECLERLEVAVERIHHQVTQRAVLVLGQQRIPVAAPEQLDDVPARATELAFEFLHDLAVAAHRAIQALQVAVDHEHQVVQLLTGRQANRAQALGLVHLAVAAEHPDLALGRVGNATGMQVFQEAGLIYRHQGAKAHGHGGKLPETGHQLGVRVAGNALAVHLLAEVDELVFSEAAFEEGTGIHAGGAVALDIEQVAAVLATRVGIVGVPEVVETHAKHGGQRRE
jgi:hypothetical protein